MSQRKKRHTNVFIFHNVGSDMNKKDSVGEKQHCASIYTLRTAIFFFFNSHFSRDATRNAVLSQLAWAQKLRESWATVAGAIATVVLDATRESDPKKSPLFFSFSLSQPQLKKKRQTKLSAPGSWHVYHLRAPGHVTRPSYRVWLLSISITVSLSSHSAIRDEIDERELENLRGVSDFWRFHIRSSYLVCSQTPGARYGQVML